MVTRSDLTVNGKAPQSRAGCTGVSEHLDGRTPVERQIVHPTESAHSSATAITRSTTGSLMSEYTSTSGTDLSKSHFERYIGRSGRRVIAKPIPKKKARRSFGEPATSHMEVFVDRSGDSTFQNRFDQILGVVHDSCRNVIASDGRAFEAQAL